MRPLVVPWPKLSTVVMTGNPRKLQVDSRGQVLSAHNVIGVVLLSLLCTVVWNFIGSSPPPGDQRKYTSKPQSPHGDHDAMEGPTQQMMLLLNVPSPGGGPGEFLGTLEVTAFKVLLINPIISEVTLLVTLGLHRVSRTLQGVLNVSLSGIPIALTPS